MGLRLTKAYTAGLDVRKRLYWGRGAFLKLFRLSPDAPIPVEIAQLDFGWHARQVGDGWEVEIAESPSILESQIAKAQRLRWLDLEIEVTERVEPPQRARRIWVLRGSVVRKTEEQV